MVHRPADDRLPVLVGCGDVTDATTPIEVGRSPFDLIAQALHGQACRDVHDPAAGAEKRKKFLSQEKDSLEAHIVETVELLLRRLVS
jgi:hypothetical protein